LRWRANRSANMLRSLLDSLSHGSMRPRRPSSPGASPESASPMIRRVGMALVALPMATGCGSSATSQDEVVVSAAASLTAVFVALEERFEDTHDGADVVLNLAGSSSLRAQILEGAPADLFASADHPDMNMVVEAGLTYGEPKVFALNRLHIAVPVGNPGRVAGLDAFADGDLAIGLCAPAVPCGALARRVFAAAGVVPEADTDERDVRALLTKIEAGELDAGIVYLTDVVGSGADVDGIPISPDVNLEVPYPAAVLTGSPNPDGAEAFLAFLLSSEGRRIISEHGFELP
jgi:molybdate transport system substrate-binding protein